MSPSPLDGERRSSAGVLRVAPALKLALDKITALKLLNRDPGLVVRCATWDKRRICSPLLRLLQALELSRISCLNWL